MGKDYYSILGVEQDADEATIKQAYKKLALKWHPDRNPDHTKSSEEKFKEACNGSVSERNIKGKMRTHPNFLFFP